MSTDFTTREEYITREEYKRDMEELDKNLEKALKLLREYIDVSTREVKDE